MSFTFPRIRPRAAAAAGVVVALGAGGAALLAPTAAGAATITTTKTYNCYTLPVGGQVSNTFTVATTKTYTLPDSVNVGSTYRVGVTGFTATADAAGSNIIRSSSAVRGTPGPYVEDIARVNGSSASYRIGTRYAADTALPKSNPATITLPGQGISGTPQVGITGAGSTLNITPDAVGSLNVFEPASFTLRLNRFPTSGTQFVAASLQCDSRGLSTIGTITVNPAGTPTTTTTAPTTTTVPPTTTTTTTVPPTTTTVPPTTTTVPPTTTTTVPPTTTTTVAPTTTTTTVPPTTTTVPPTTTTTVPPTTTTVPPTTTTTTVPPTTTTTVPPTTTTTTVPPTTTTTVPPTTTTTVPPTTTTTVPTTTTTVPPTTTPPTAGPADLRVSVTTPSSIARGATVSATLTVRNSGPNASAPGLSAFYAAGGVRIVNGGGGTVNAVSSTFATPSLAPGQSITFTVQLQQRGTLGYAIFVGTADTANDPRTSNNQVARAAAIR